MTVPPPPDTFAAPAAALPRPLLRRLRDTWRSAGWPCHDALELELLALGLLARREVPGELDTLRVTDAGLRALALGQQRNRAALSRHEALVQRVAAQLATHGRVAYTGLSLRAWIAEAQAADGPLGEQQAASAAADAPAVVQHDLAGALPPRAPGRWQVVKPDVFSIRFTTAAQYLQPQVHEIKVSRADLLGDLRNPAKRAGYHWLSGACYYVLREGIGDDSDVPADYGVLLARPERLEVLRAAPGDGRPLPFAVWMALARATPVAGEDDGQRWLGGDGQPQEGPQPDLAQEPLQEPPAASPDPLPPTGTPG